MDNVRKYQSRRMDVGKPSRQPLDRPPHIAAPRAYPTTAPVTPLTPPPSSYSVSYSAYAANLTPAFGQDRIQVYRHFKPEQMPQAARKPAPPIATARWIDSVRLYGPAATVIALSSLLALLFLPVELAIFLTLISASLVLETDGKPAALLTFGSLIGYLVSSAMGRTETANMLINAGFYFLLCAVIMHMVGNKGAS